jgi:hypothetical protein
MMPVVNMLEAKSTLSRLVEALESGAEIVTAFCGTCGAPIYSAKGDTPRYLNVRLGAVSRRADLPPRLQGFCDSAMPWAWDITGVPQVPNPART